MLTIILISLVAGSLAGLIAGMFGLGGGVVFVPTIMFILDFIHVPSSIYMHMVLGTSLSCIVITTTNSSWSNYRRDNINWTDFKKLVFGLVLGVIIGGVIANHLSSLTLKIFFALFLTFITVKMWMGLKVEVKPRSIADFWYWLAGFVIGIKSSILGIGGGTISVPFLNWTGRSMKQAVGVSALLGVVISTIGSATYIYSGLHINNLPQYSFGYLYLPAWGGISLMSSIFSHVGVRLASRIDNLLLRKLFAILLLFVLAKTYWSVYTALR